MAILWHFAIVVSIAIVFIPTSTLPMNVTDQCWRKNPNWHMHQCQVATCSMSFSGKITDNVGKDIVHYKVTDPGDDTINPKLGTLRYGATLIPQKQCDHLWAIHPPLLSEGPKPYAIRLVTTSKVWIDHNIRYECQDGLIDVRRGSTDVTISNNWFRNQEKRQNMKVIVVNNHFGPNRNQRLPGYTQYAIGGSMNPSIKSQANLLIAPKVGNKKEQTFQVADAKSARSLTSESSV
ncbi:hypothetical protein CISIN_1g046181mg [Citrus sinensis]|uniref:Pectate lyase domain-containing protein n=1 Tax=Citrus sinensis TaxID=2711 RepID=A0A067DF21_CITSI|nr:hypothetical protein CISIN_1g046181mg [Citrus sinensis]